MQKEDYVANLISIGGITLTLAEFQTILTIGVLITGLILNVVRIMVIRNNNKNK